MKIEEEILIVDDEIPNLRILTELLEKEGYQVRPTSKPQTAIDTALDKPPSLILLDVRMPKIDGFEVCRCLKQDNRTKHVPIIFVSALQDTDARVRGFEAGGVDFISKPYQEAEILARVRTHIQLHRMQQNLEQLVEERTFELNESRLHLKQKVRELQESEKRLSLIYDSTADILFYIKVEPDDCFRFLSINSAFLTTTGLTEDQIVGKRIEEVIPEPSIQLVLDNYKKAIKENRIVRWEETSVYPSGEKIGHVSIAPVLNEKGICTHLVGSVHDITEQKKAELNYRTVADFTYDWEYWSNMDGTLEYVSPSCERISGYSVQQFKENPELFREIIMQEDKNHWKAHRHKAEKQSRPGQLQFRIQRKDGEIRWIEHACQPVTDSQGGPLGFRASNRDITERKQAEFDAQRHRAELTHVSRITTLGELSASLAHELNQPLTAILSNAQAARRFLTGELTDPDEVNEILNDIIDDDKRAADIIKRLRALMQRKDLEFNSLDLNHVIRGVAKLVNREVFIKDVPLVLSLADGLPHVQGDAIHLEQVILNLILNGTEAMETIDHQFRELRILTVEDEENAVRVSVRDKGTGIDHTHIDNIFEAFYTTKTEGMGMGLSICRSIIEAHGGRLWAENNPDKGATVFFTVPLSKGDKA